MPTDIEPRRRGALLHRQICGLAPSLIGFSTLAQRMMRHTCPNFRLALLTQAFCSGRPTGITGGAASQCERPGPHTCLAPGCLPSGLQPHHGPAATPASPPGHGPSPSPVTAPLRSAACRKATVLGVILQPVSVAALREQPLSAAHHPCCSLVTGSVSHGLLFARDLMCATVTILLQQDGTISFTRYMQFDRKYSNVTSFRCAPELEIVLLVCHITLVTSPHHLRFTELVYVSCIEAGVGEACVLKSSQECRAVPLVRSGGGRHAGGQARRRGCAAQGAQGAAQGAGAAAAAVPGAAGPHLQLPARRPQGAGAPTAAPLLQHSGSSSRAALLHRLSQQSSLAKPETVSIRQHQDSVLWGFRPHLGLCVGRWRRCLHSRAGPRSGGDAGRGGWRRGCSGRACPFGAPSRARCAVPGAASPSPSGTTPPWACSTSWPSPSGCTAGVQVPPPPPPPPPPRGCTLRTC